MNDEEIKESEGQKHGEIAAGNLIEEESKDAPETGAKKAKQESNNVLKSDQKDETDQIVIHTSIDMETISTSTISIAAIS